MGGRLPLLVASGLAVVALVGCSGSGSTATTASRAAGDGPTRIVHTDFADGIPSGWEARRAAVEHASGAADPGSWVRLDATGTPAYVSLPPDVLASGRPRFAFSGRFRVRTRAPGQSVGLATVENGAGEHHADLFVDARTGRCRVDLLSDDSAMSPGRCDDAAWHRVTMAGDYGTSTYTLRWTLDGVAMPPITSAAQPPTTVHRLWLGDATPAKTNGTDWTDVTLELV